MLGVVSESRTSVLDVVHSRTAPKRALNEVQVMLTVGNRGSGTPRASMAALAGAGFVAVEDD